MTHGHVFSTRVSAIINNWRANRFNDTPAVFSAIRERQNPPQRVSLTYWPRIHNTFRSDALAAEIYHRAHASVRTHFRTSSDCAK